MKLGRSWIGLLARHRWLTFFLPMAVFLLAGSLEPTPDSPGGKAIGLAIPYQAYPWVYTGKIVLTLAAICLVLPGYRQFPFRVGWLGIGVGLVGAAVWIVLAQWRPEARWLGSVLSGVGIRSGFNPLAEIDSRGWAVAFLGVRLIGLALVVPLIEEFFLRGWVMRYLIAPNWWKVPVGKLNAAAIVVGTALPMLSHPQEVLAAAVWFSLVTWLSAKTRNIWDCIAAHAATNLILGGYVLISGHWYLM